MRTITAVPDSLPRLSAGAHRSPRRGACFMEFASFLAGEPWSDHPECTDPALAALARAVNDGMSDERRDELLTLIPRVIGLRGDDAKVGPIVALRAAACALPVASMERQRSLAVGVLAIRRDLAAHGLGRDPAEDAAAAALLDVPDAAAWAQRFVAELRPLDAFRPAGIPVIVRTAAIGIAAACIDDPDTLLRETLDLAISDVERVIRLGSRGHTTAPDRITTSKEPSACLERTSPVPKPRSARGFSVSSPMSSRWT